MVTSIFTAAFLLLFCTSTATGVSFSNILSDPPSSLRSTLRRFSRPRHHSHPQGKERARNYIKKTFRESGLYVWSEYAPLSKALNGENIVAMVRGRHTGTADDRIVIVGAHYDTTSRTKGVDDNGSGVTALLEIAKQIGRANCQTENTMLFVAFDFEEDTMENHYLVPFGSMWFVRNLTEYLKITGGAIEGAFILEMIANYNTTKGSQLFPRKFGLISPDAYKEVKDDGSRGNFLALIGRRDSEEHLMNLLNKYYQNDSNYRAQLVPIPLSGRPTHSNYGRYFRQFYRSDHYSFWENEVSFRAVMLTDTSNFRRNMNRCYHRKCDNMKQITKKDLEFLRRNINAVLKSVLDLSKADSCNTNFLGTKRSILKLSKSGRSGAEKTNYVTTFGVLLLITVILHIRMTESQ